MAQEPDQPGGDLIHYGIREHGMGGVMTGMAAHRGILPVGGTFFVFSDYMRGAVRIAALSNVHVVYSWTHDSIGLGQDGPTHQPIEQLAAMRAMPQLRVIRPADANETAQAWRIAVDRDGPTALILSRQALPVLAETATLAPDGVARGAYVLRDPDSDPPRIVLIGTGSEVQLCLAAADLLAAGGIAARVVSFPSWDLFADQPEGYRREVFPGGIPRLAVEAASSFGWERYADATVCIDQFGASAPGDVAMEEFGFTPEHVAERANLLLGAGPTGDRGRRPGPRLRSPDQNSVPPERTPMTTLNDLYDQQGQSPWIDNLRRDWLEDGTMAGLVADGIRGVTSNPTILAKAIDGQDTYDDQFGALIKTKSVEDAYWDLVVDDINAALAILRPVYDSSGGTDGFVSVEVAPALAHDTEGTINAARSLHQRIDQPNVLVKIPATQEGVPAIRQMISEGRSINVTLIFSITRYGEVIEAYLSGLEALVASGTEDLSHVASVASFFISRVDTEVDRRIESAAGSDAKRTSSSSCGARRPWPRVAWPTSCSRRTSPGPAGRHWPPRGPGSSARCGPRPRPRTRTTPTCSTWTR